MLRQMPFLRVLAIAQTLLLARRHLRGLDMNDRRRMLELVRHGRAMTPEERDELRRLLSKLEPRAFAFAAANTMSPVRLPRWLVTRLTR
jgi:plasmid stability protein